MSSFVLDGSVALSWCFPDEANAYAQDVLDSLTQADADVPAVWPLDVANGLLVAERRKRIMPGESDRFREKLRLLPISVSLAPGSAPLDDCLRLGREHSLSAYDASYLLLARQLSLPLATLDEPLREAARKAGVTLYKP